MLVAFVLYFILKCCSSTLEAYTGDEPIHSVSPIFSVKLTQNGNTILPHVYYEVANTSNYECSGYAPPLGPDWYGRTLSFVEFGQKSTDTVTIQVIIENNIPYFNNTPRILPLSYNIKPQVSNDFLSLSFQVTGNFKSISVEYGEYKVGNKLSNFFNAMMIFIGDLTPNINKNASNVLYFGPGEQNISSKGGRNTILTIPKTIDTIFFERGAYVYGKINDNPNVNGILNIIGYGILSGTYFNFCARQKDSKDNACMIESGRSLNYLGLTIYNPSWFMTQNEIQPNSYIKSFKGLGWYLNQDCIGVSSNSVIEDSFCRTASDSFKFETGSNVTLRNNVCWQLYSGMVHQMGWFSHGVQNVYVNNTDVLRAEWREDNYGGTSVIGLVGWQREENYNANYSNIRIENIRIDNPVGRIFDIELQYCDPAYYHIMNGMYLNNIMSATPLAWTTDLQCNKTGPIWQRIEIKYCGGTCSIDNINFNNVIINGTKIISNTQNGWDLRINGTGHPVNNVTYS